MRSKEFKRKIIVNADDLGLSEGINNGILECFLNGVITRASIIACGSAFNHAVSLLRLNPSLTIGIHLTLIEENPISNHSAVKSLINSQGTFYKNYKIFLLKYFLGQIKLSEITNELEAQIKKVFDSGLKINHIDSHQHIHMLPGIFHIVGNLAKKYNIKSIRIPKAYAWKMKSIKEISLTCLAQICKKEQLKLGIRNYNNFWGFNQSGNIKKEELINFLDNLMPGTTEIMCHPGYVDSEYNCRYSHWHYNPEGELKVLTNPAVKEFIRKKGIEMLF